MRPPRFGGAFCCAAPDEEWAMISAKPALAILAALCVGLPASALWDLLVKNTAWRGRRQSSHQVSIDPIRHPFKFWSEAAGYILMIFGFLAYAVFLWRH
jgi:hypothetical protein